jgi:hypothetical protein
MFHLDILCVSYWHVQVKTLAATKRWDELQALVPPRATPPIGFMVTVDVLAPVLFDLVSFFYMIICLILFFNWLFVLLLFFSR